MILFQIISGVFLIISLILLFFYLRIKKKSINELNLVQNELNITKEKLTVFNDFQSSLKQGYYTYTLNVVNKDNTKNAYICNVYIKEIDRYTNGLSKIELVKIEIVSGLDLDQYYWVKQGVEARFSSIKKTSEIEWLESVESIKKLRKKKLEELFKNSFYGNK